MMLVEQHIISDKTISKEIDNLMWLSKNLYNLTLYNIRQHYFKTNKWLTYLDIYYIMRETDAYKQLPDKVSKGTIRKLYDNLNSFFQALKAWKLNPSKFTGRPKIPKYLDVLDLWLFMKEMQLTQKTIKKIKH